MSANLLARRMKGKIGRPAAEMRIHTGSDLRKLCRLRCETVSRRGIRHVTKASETLTGGHGAHNVVSDQPVSVIHILVPFPLPKH